MRSLKVHDSGVYANMQAKAEKKNVCDGCGGPMEYVRNIGSMTWKGEYKFVFLCRKCFDKFVEVMKNMKCYKREEK